MAKGLPDLDRSLDETIRLNKSKVNSRLGRTVPPKLPRSKERDGSLIIKSKSQKEKTNPILNRRDNSHVNKRVNPQITKRTPQVNKQAPQVNKRAAQANKQVPQVSRRDASNIIITKAINTRSTITSGGSIVIKRDMPVKKKETAPKHLEEPPAIQSNPIINTTLSPPVYPTKNIVLICNLDPRATASDVGEACKIFGPVLSCDMLVDPMGRPLCEAEIEFVYPDSAERCVAQLDNNYADGRILRAKLQSTPTMPVVPRYASRTVAASTRVNQSHDANSSPLMAPPQHLYQHHRDPHIRRL